ncbi:hypothetical protein WJX72_005387 [[Myrmecia] bisecta]|uniref:Uncharacterized protein n=1 Tax=[Myrmecia] bisecta TaxID=41462 RepID=A0AAW1PWR2_9CHLO
MLGRLIRHFIRLPLQLLRQTLKQVTFSKPPVLSNSLPVAGLDESHAHTVLSALRQAARSPEEVELSDLWLATLQLAQIASDRLLRDLKSVDRTLSFWRTRQKQGQHLAFMLLGQGPISFVKDVGRLVSRQHSQRKLTASDKIERRVIVLRSLRSTLTEALAAVHTEAGTLYLRGTRQRRGATNATAGTSNLEPRLFVQAKRAIMLTNACIAETFDGLAAKVVEVIGASETARIQAADALVRDAAVLHALGPTASRRMFTVDSEQHLVEAGAAASSSSQPRAPTEEDIPVGSISGSIGRAAAALGIELPEGKGLSANTALSQAASISARQRRLVRLPHWVRMPSRYQQYWVRYSVATAVALWTSLFLYKHSRLAGSRDLEVWTRNAVDVVIASYQEHVIKPLATLRDELFKTFRERRSIVSSDEFEADKASLQRMLADFEADYLKAHKGHQPQIGAPPAEPAAGDAGQQVAALPGMEFMMQCYEDELKKPIRNLVNGQLARSLLIQVQKLKVDTESAMLEMDQILKANELSIALVAAVPAFLVAGATLVLVWRWLTPSPPNRSWEALPCRMAMVELERAILALLEDGSAENQGMLVYRLALVYEEAYSLFRRFDTSSGPSEWPNLRQDLIELASPLHKQKLRTSKRMMRVYTIFKF